MTREQAIHRLISSGFTENQVSEIVRALTYEPTTKNDLGVDCISRQSVLDKIQRLINAEQNNIDENGDYMNYARERVNAYEAIQFFVENDCLCPSVTPQEPRWIPVEEKLPEDGQSVLFCDIDNDIMVGYHVKGRPNTHFSQDGTYEDIKNVRAWMPLPQPYEPQESEVDNGNDD